MPKVEHDLRAIMYLVRGALTRHRRFLVGALALVIQPDISAHYVSCLRHTHSRFQLFARPPPQIASRRLAVGVWQMIGGDCGQTS